MILNDLTLKTCSNPKCVVQNPQAMDNFARKPRYKNGVYSRCRDCVNKTAVANRANNPKKAHEKDKKNYWRHPDKNRKKARACRFKAKYWPHLTSHQAQAEWDRMFAEQQGLCSICEKPKPLEVEHCHMTGKVRSLACNGCNTALARIHENIRIAQNIIGYIEKHECSQNQG